MLCLKQIKDWGAFVVMGKRPQWARISEKFNNKKKNTRSKAVFFRSKRCGVFVCSRRLDGASVEVCEINLGGFGVDELCFHWALHRVVKV